MIKKIILFLFILLIWITLSGTEIYPVNNLLNPSQIVVDKSAGEIFIVEGTAIQMFTAADLKLQSTFGKAGEGPGEILPPVSIDIGSKDIMVNSRNKVSFYNRKLTFIRELKLTSGKRFARAGTGFVGQGFKVIGQDGYETFNLFSADFSKGDEIVSRKSPIQHSGKIPVLSSPFIFRVGDGLVYYSVSDRMEIGIFDNGKNKFTGFRADYKRKPFTDNDRTAFENYFKNNPKTKKNYEILRQRLAYPDHYPAIRTFLVSDGKVYVLTYKKDKNGACELFILGTGGELIKKTALPVKEMNIFRPFPFTISDSKLYQLIETDDEKWELHINKI